MEVPKMRPPGEGLPVPGADDVDPAEIEATDEFWSTRPKSAKRFAPGETVADVMVDALLKMVYSPPVTDAPPVRGVFCRKWLGVSSTTSEGYARPYHRLIPSKRGYAHRRMWKKFYRRPVPKGFVIHHLCGNKWCGEPLHLWALTRTDHSAVHRTLRGSG